MGPLMDIAKMRREYDELARESSTLDYYGQGFSDGITPVEEPEKDPYILALALTVSLHPHTWTPLLATTTSMTLLSKDDDLLRRNLACVAAVAVAWMEEIDRRGKKKVTA